MEKFAVSAITYLILVFASRIALAGNDNTSASHEYKIKSTYIYNLTKFVKWPAVTSQPVNNKDPQMTICVYGYTPILKFLNEQASQASLEPPTRISYTENVHSLSGCHIIFIPKSTPGPASILSKITNYPFLTVGEHSSFVDDGGIIGLIINKSGMQLQVNLTLAKKLGFEISGSLLEIANTVK